MHLRYAISSILRGRGATLAAIVALALGIGANTAIFSFVRAVLLQPLPYRDSDRLVSLLEQDSNPLGADDFIDIRSQARSFDGVAAAELWSANLSGHDNPEQIVGMHVSQDLFRVLGVTPVRGRTFDAGDFAPGKRRVLVIGYGLWQRVFGGAPDVIGKDVKLDGEAYTIVGVMPRAFYFAPFWVTQAEMWSPLDLHSGNQGRRGGGSLRGFARLAPGIDLRQANAELSQIASALAAAYPNFDAGVHLIAEPLPQKAMGNVRPILELMFAAVGMVLLIACANVANLALARATAREKETAVRLALGASRGRIARQFLTESVVMSLLGGAAGVLLAQSGVAFLQTMLRPDAGDFRARLLQSEQAGVDGVVLLFTLLLSIATGILFGLAPAMAGWRGEVSPLLKEGGRGSTSGPRGARLRSALVAAEIAIALVLAVGAGLLMRSFVRLRAVDPGFDPRNVVTMTVSVAGRPDYVGSRRDALYQQILDRVSAIPGVSQTSMINHLPLAGDQWGFPYWIEGQPLPDPAKIPILVFRSAQTNYFRTMGVPLIAGRDFTDRDTAGVPDVVIVNETLARRIGDPIGKRISFSDPGRNPEWATIVGVVGNVVQSWAEPARPEAYIPYLQNAPLRNAAQPFAAYMTLVARTRDDASRLIEPVKNAVWSIDRTLPLAHVQTVEHAVGNATWGPRFSLFVAATFSALALVLAMIGVYSVMAYQVAERTHEIGIRIALGAGTRGVLALIARQSIPVAIIGIAAGLGAATGLVRLMRTMLYQVDAFDPATFAAVAGLMLIVATLAALIPARRALRVDPMIALRNE